MTTFNFEIHSEIQNHNTGSGLPHSIVLSNGATIHLRGDGTGTDRVFGDEYVEISRGIGEPVDGEYEQYEYLGWALVRDAQNGGYIC